MDVSGELHTPAGLTFIAPRAGVGVLAKNVIPDAAGNRTPVVQPTATHRSLHA
jgi:hypothetical protein